eukprot:COSAG01_NODE_513_length_16049_cov_57.758056_20_plen_107_part_00
MSSIRVLSLDGSLSSSPPPISGGHSRLRIIEGARAGQFFQQDFSQNQQNFDLPGCWIDQQIDLQKYRSCTATDHKGQSRVNAPVVGGRALAERTSGQDRRVGIPTV